jgi:glycosyltransferase involved in cell wall biosynthesis
MEAMACGCAVIVSNAGGGGELFEAGVHGLPVVPSDMADLAAQLRVLLTDPERRSEMGQAAARHMVEKFSVSAAVGATQRIYQTLVSGV